MIELLRFDKGKRSIECERTRFLGRWGAVKSPIVAIVMLESALSGVGISSFKTHQSMAAV